MNAPVDCSNSQVSDLSQSLQQPTCDLAPAGLTNTPPNRETTPAADEKICWIEVRESPYPPNQQVELLHLQAEAEALLLQLQTLHDRRQR